MKQFKISMSAKSLSILAVVTGAKINFAIEGNQLVVGSKTTNTDEDAKEAGNASLLAKYVRDWVNNSKGTMETRIKRMAEILRQFDEVTTFRTLNNCVRRTTDDGSVFPIGTYFYEGTGHPLKVAAREKAAKGNKKVTKAPAAKKVAKVAPVVKAKTVKKATPVAKAKPAAKVATVKRVRKVTPAAVPAVDVPALDAVVDTPAIVIAE